ncbi:hypothetical protein LEP1GSC038_3937 [Leptospira weilii str. 2006001855]|uniref:Uncharacterized protein n=1 Tax=Leptospira weilii str. 2006001855 TaxID=996804 RepID=M6FM06_9LEPT|nr:hypothetical protein LEP1GSC038_3937 [Leptospira weilii str. 2006001855]
MPGILPLKRGIVSKFVELYHRDISKAILLEGRFRSFTFRVANDSEILFRKMLESELDISIMDIW